MMRALPLAIRAALNAKSPVPVPRSTIRRILAAQHRADRLCSPPGVEAKTDDAIEEIVASGDPVEHALNGLVARMAGSGHYESER